MWQLHWCLTTHFCMNMIFHVLLFDKDKLIKQIWQLSCINCKLCQLYVVHLKLTWVSMWKFYHYYQHSLKEDDRSFKCACMESSGLADPNCSFVCTRKCIHREIGLIVCKIIEESKEPSKHIQPSFICKCSRLHRLKDTEQHGRTPSHQL